MAKKLCLKKYYGNDGSLEAFLICKLIPLDKNPGVKPIGILGLRILGRTVMRTFKKKKKKKNVLETALDLQLYGGQGVGHEAAVHTVR